MFTTHVNQDSRFPSATNSSLPTEAVHNWITAYYLFCILCFLRWHIYTLCKMALDLITELTDGIWDFLNSEKHGNLKYLHLVSPLSAIHQPAHRSQFCMHSSDLVLLPPIDPEDDELAHGICMLLHCQGWFEGLVSNHECKHLVCLILKSTVPV